MQVRVNFQLAAYRRNHYCFSRRGGPTRLRLEKLRLATRLSEIDSSMPLCWQRCIAPWLTVPCGPYSDSASKRYALLEARFWIARRTGEVSAGQVFHANE